MIYAGVEKGDPRVTAATGWIRKHYTLDENPNMGQQGLFYYFHTFAKTMSAIDEDEFADAAGKKHHWKTELAEKLRSLQHANGKAGRTLLIAGTKGDPNLVTAYCLIALHYCEE